MKVRIRWKFWDDDDPEYWKNQLMTFTFFLAIVAAGNIVYLYWFSWSISMVIINLFVILLYMLMLRSKTTYDKKRREAYEREQEQLNALKEVRSEGNKDPLQEVQKIP